MICYGLVDWLIRYPMTAVVTVVFTSCPTRGGQQRNQFIGCAGGKPSQSAIQISKILSQEMIGYRNKQKTKLFKPWIIPFILKDQTETSANRAGIVKITNVRILLETNSTLISDQQGSGNGFNFGSIRFLLTCFN